MNRFNPAEPVCERVRRSLDSRAGGEPVGACDDEARRPLEGCPACPGPADERERVRALLRRAVRREPAPEVLRGRIREMIRRGTGGLP
jgi:hypothetical protein